MFDDILSFCGKLRFPCEVIWTAQASQIRTLWVSASSCFGPLGLSFDTLVLASILEGFWAHFGRLRGDGGEPRRQTGHPLEEDCRKDCGLWIDPALLGLLPTASWVVDRPAAGSTSPSASTRPRELGLEVGSLCVCMCVCGAWWVGCVCVCVCVCVLCVLYVCVCVHVSVLVC